MRARLTLLVGAAAMLAAFGIVAACSDDNAIKETVAKDSGTVDGQQSGADGATPGADGAVGPDGAVLDDCVAKPDPNSYTDLLNACTDSYKLDPHPTLPLLYVDGGLPPLP
jgi:hypothetical protein